MPPFTPPPSRFHSRFSPALAAVALLYACGGTTESEQLASIILTVSDATIAVHDTVELEVRAFNSNGEELVPAGGGTTVDRASFEVTPSGVIAVANVTVAGIGEGSAWLIADVENRRDSVLFEVDGTAHRGDIAKDEVWTATDGPHLVRTVMHVGTTAAATLTIEAGAVVKFSQNTGLYFDGSAGGTLRAIGTVSSPIRMMADADANAPDETLRGFWLNVAVTDSQSELHFVELRHCSGEGQVLQGHVRACLILADLFGLDPRPLIDHVTIRYAGIAGMAVQGGAGFGAGSTDLTVTDVGGTNLLGTVPLFIEANEVGTIPSNTNFEDNATNAILVDRLGTDDGQWVSETQTWRNSGVPFLINEDVIVEGPTAPVLSLEAGTELQFATFTSLEIGKNAPGGLVAMGQDAMPIVFTSQGPPQLATWDAVLFGGETLPSSKLDRVVVEGGGGFNAQFPWDGEIVVFLNGLDRLVTNSVIRLSIRCGVRRAWEPAPMNTDYTAAELGNTFADNRFGDQCGPP